MSIRNHIFMIVFVLTIISIFMYEGYWHHPWDYDEKVYIVRDGSFQYNLMNPDEKFVMPKEMVEISALSIYKNDQLVAVQDEEAVLYFYDINEQKVIRKEVFGKKGDYEGVEIVRDTAYILRSNGVLYSFEIKKNKIGEVSEIKTDLTSDNDAEGLGYDVVKNELLIACKARPETKNSEVKGRAIYSYRLGEKRFKKKPRYHISEKDYERFLLKKELDKKKHLPYKPSGIAIHPFTKNLYIIGSVGKMLTILDRDKEILDLIPLDPDIFRQPEGICFDHEGSLFISSEGDGELGYIVKFSLIPE